MAPISQPKRSRTPLLFTSAELLTPYLSRHPTASDQGLELALSNILIFGNFKKTEEGSGIYMIYAPRSVAGIFKRVKEWEVEINKGGILVLRGEEMAVGYCRV
jgi:hypothetical protein